MTISFARHQFPPAIIRHAVWLYVRFALSYRDVEDLLAERGLDVSYETVRRWVLKFGPLFAQELARRRPRPTSRWHLDEMAVIIAGEQFWLWRAVDDEGEVLDLLVQRQRGNTAAVKLMRKLMKKQGFVPDVLVTDRLRSYGAAKAELKLTARREQRATSEQSRRKFASAGSATRAQDAAFQIAGISSALLVCSRSRLQQLQPSAPPRIPQHAPHYPRGGVPDVASRDRRLTGIELPRLRAAPFDLS